MVDDRGGSEGLAARGVGLAGVVCGNRAPSRPPAVPDGGCRPPGWDRGPAVLLTAMAPADLPGVQKKAVGILAPSGPPAAKRWPRGPIGRRRGVTALAWSPRLGSRLPAVGGHMMKFLLKLSFYRIKQERVHDAELRCVLFLLSGSPRKARQGHFCGSDILKRLLPATERGERSEEADRAPTSAHVG